MIEWLKSLFSTPKPSGPTELLRVFSPADRPITVSGASLDQQAWRFEVREPQSIRLYEVFLPNLEKSIVLYQAQIRTENLKGRCFLEMWCRFPGQGSYFSKGLNQTLGGTMDWVSLETPFLLKKGQKPDLIQLNIAVEGSGIILVRDIKLLKTPL